MRQSTGDSQWSPSAGRYMLMALLCPHFGSSITLMSIAAIRGVLADPSRALVQSQHFYLNGA